MLYELYPIPNVVIVQLLEESNNQNSKMYELLANDQYIPSLSRLLWQEWSATLVLVGTGILSGIYYLKRSKFSRFYVVISATMYLLVYVHDSGILITSYNYIEFYNSFISFTSSSYYLIYRGVLFMFFIVLLFMVIAEIGYSYKGSKPELSPRN